MSYSSDPVYSLMIPQKEMLSDHGEVRSSFTKEGYEKIGKEFIFNSPTSPINAGVEECAKYLKKNHSR